MGRLFQVTAPYFCAGFIVGRGSVYITRAAPIINWMIGKPWELMRIYCRHKNWKFEEII